jgi:hypothetical protein
LRWELFGSGYHWLEYQGDQQLVLRQPNQCLCGAKHDCLGDDDNLNFEYVNDFNFSRDYNGSAVDYKHSGSELLLSEDWWTRNNRALVELQHHQLG